MPTTILTEGWSAAGDRFRGMLRAQLLALGEVAEVDVAPEGVSEGGAAADERVVYGFGRGGAAARPDSARRAWFHPAGPGGVEEGDASLLDGDACIVVPSHWARRRVIAAGAPADRVTVVMPGIDGAAFSPLSRIEREAVRTRLGFAQDETALLHVGDGGTETGIDLALRAFARLRAAGARVRLVLATDDPGHPVDYDRIVRDAAGAEPALRDPQGLAAIATIPGALAPDGWRQLYGAADVLVAPDRGCAFPFPVLEALACGRPVVTTRGGAGDDLCCDDLAWRVSGTVSDDAQGRRSLAPDLDELTDALAEIARGHGFDRLRFATARLRLLREATWARSARRLAAALGCEASPARAGPPRPAVSHGLPQSVSHRPTVPPPRDRVPLGRRPTRRVTCPGPEDLSVVVQGPCLRKAIEPGAPSIDEAIASIRRSFPGAQVIVSTWLGSDVDGLDADDIVLSPDPGSLTHPRHPPNNVNRMVTSTANGLAAATRPFCIKTRNDLRFASPTVIDRPLHGAGPSTGFERRIWAKAGKVDAFLRPYHPSDMMMFGRTADLRRLWNIPATAASDVFLPDPESPVARMSPEQALFVGYLNSIGQTIELESSFDGRRHIIAGSVAQMLACFDIFDETDVDLVMPRRFVDGKVPSLCYTSAEFEALRAEFHDDANGTSHRIYEAFHHVLNGLLDRPAVAHGNL